MQNHSRIFLGVGAQKAGTTTLHMLLGLHPEIFLPERKELQYFSLNFSKSLDWYFSNFSERIDGQCMGEITPYYLFHPHVAERIFNVLGKIKIIVLLRDPVARTLSHYAHSRRLGFEHLPLEEALNSESSRLRGAELAIKNPNCLHKKHQECSYLSRSLYRIQVQRYWNYFGRDNVYIQPSEYLFSEPWGSLMKIHNFLGVQEQIKPQDSDLLVHANAGQKSAQYINYKKEILENLRLKLDDSYEFARKELGWEQSLQWSWD